MRFPSENDDEPGLFLDDEEQGTALAGAASAGGDGDGQAPPWRILIVDDDVDVHVVTKFALSTARFQNRRLSFVHAYSAAEALAKLRETQDIALILLDVMMETTDAGLQLARQVREQGNDLVRIVLRTGQPGQAVEHSIIVDYDINDFWSKADLTTRKLFTTVIAALRAYATLARAAAARDQALARLGAAEQALQLAQAAAPMLRFDREGKLIEANQAAAELTGLDPLSLAQPDGHEVLGIHTVAAILNALDSEGAWQGTVQAQLAGGLRSVRCAAAKQADGSVLVFASLLG